MATINVEYQYFVNWQHSKNRVIIEGPFSQTDPKMNQFGSTMYFNGCEFFEKNGCVYEESCIDSAVVKKAQACWDKNYKEQEYERHDYPANDMKGRG